LRAGTGGGILKLLVASNGVLKIRSEIAGQATFNTLVNLGAGWHGLELCGTVGTASTWDMYRDGALVLNDWAANTGTVPIGRVQIGDHSATTITARYDDVRVDQAAG
jgi:hypothetical protein